MFKVIALLRRKAGISREAFIDYYESRHAPLILSLLPQIREYRRNYFDLTGAIFGPGVQAPDFDVVTELWMEDRAAYDAFMARSAEPDVAARIAADEENFLDRSATRFIVVDEHSSVIP